MSQHHRKIDVHKLIAPERRVYTTDFDIKNRTSQAILKTHGSAISPTFEEDIDNLTSAWNVILVNS